MGQADKKYTQFNLIMFYHLQLPKLTAEYEIKHYIQFSYTESVFVVIQCLSAEMWQYSIISSISSSSSFTTMF
jgi:hypothetical protein